MKGGEVVEPGATLVIVEAMKMENELRAPVEARVERVLVAPGEAVEKGSGPRRVRRSGATVSNGDESSVFDRLPPGFRVGEDLGEPGAFPYTRGIHRSMYRGRRWTMRQYAGFGTAGETNARYHFLLGKGTTGLSVAFDLPTQMGLRFGRAHGGRRSGPRRRRDRFGGRTCARSLTGSIWGPCRAR